MSTHDLKAERMARIVREIEDVKRAKKAANEEFSDQLTTLWRALEALALDVESGQRSMLDEPIDLGRDGVTATLQDADGNEIGTLGELAEAVGIKKRGRR
jgi:hypothetical protein